MTTARLSTGHELTLDGDLLLWQRVSSNNEPADPAARLLDWTAVKVVRAHQNACINCITTIGPFVVTGGAEGYVRFFDPQLRTLAWSDEIKIFGVRMLRMVRIS